MVQRSGSKQVGVLLKVLKFLMQGVELLQGDLRAVSSAPIRLRVLDCADSCGGLMF